MDEDFTAAHKLAFDMYVENQLSFRSFFPWFFVTCFLYLHYLIVFSTGNELTPSSKYDFKFKDYAPWVFRHLREDFHIDASDYLVSETIEKKAKGEDEEKGRRK